MLIIRTYSFIVLSDSVHDNSGNIEKYIESIASFKFLLVCINLALGNILRIILILKIFSKDLSKNNILSSCKLFKSYLSLISFFINFRSISNLTLFVSNSLLNIIFLIWSKMAILKKLLSPYVFTLFVPDVIKDSMRVDPDLGKPIINIGFTFK